ncbi:MAG: hypothetical protein DRP58_10325 [Spirochaetes bacterium]|nr:MAG: hypothetical protein DRP58_10325 [Spirochaetota bacterium]
METKKEVNAKLIEWVVCKDKLYFSYRVHFQSVLFMRYCIKNNIRKVYIDFKNGKLHVYKNKLFDHLIEVCLIRDMSRRDVRITIPKHLLNKLHKFDEKKINGKAIKRKWKVRLIFHDFPSKVTHVYTRSETGKIAYLASKKALKEKYGEDYPKKLAKKGHWDKNS